uniref:Uncharacterized protein n=1 Tax=Mycena chlorophos TaxID=658473 RepID=A0ABQ0LTH5_MYCCL|nr:predicted protein [Mycena chlorophos]
MCYAICASIISWSRVDAPTTNKASPGARKFSTQLKQLRQAQSKLKNCVVEVKPENKDKLILVPLTNVPEAGGHVGTGYFVKRTTPRRYNTTYLQSNLDTLEETITKKRENLNYPLNIMQPKLAQQQQPIQATRSWSTDALIKSLRGL